MIDVERLSELREEIGPDVLADVAVLFWEESDAVIDGLMKAPDLAPSEIGDRLHFLKGGAMNLGLSDLVDFCQTGERHAKSGAPHPVDHHHLSQVYEASKSAFLAALNTLARE